MMLDEWGWNLQSCLSMATDALNECALIDSATQWICMEDVLKTNIFLDLKKLLKTIDVPNP